MIRFIVMIASMALLPACVPTQGAGYPNYPAYQPAPGQGQYIRPEYLNPAPTPLIPPVDACRSRLYLGLIGSHEGAIHIPGLPGQKRVLKPAFDEGFNYGPEDFLYNQPPLIEVRDFLPDQLLYAPSVRTITDRIQLGPINENRLTIELDREGYVQEIRCE